MDSVLHLYGSSLESKVHPIVLFGVLDHFSRRNPDSKRVIGTLLGNITPDGVVHIKNCFPVPHNETEDEVGFDIEMHNTFYDLHARVNPREMVVGWYSTGNGIVDNDVKIHMHYATLCAQPVHLTIDTDMTNDVLGIRAFISQSMSIGGKNFGMFFQQIKLETKAFEAERIGVDFITKAALKPNQQGLIGDSGTLSSDLETLEISLQRLLELLSKVSDYTDKVLEKKIVGDVKIGRYLSETVAAVPQVSSEVVQKKFQSSLQDLLMVVYLGSLTRTQLALAHKLSSNI